MPKIFPTAMAAILLTIPAWAQDPAEEPSQEVPREEQSPSAQTEQQTQGETATNAPAAGNEAASAAGETPTPDEDDKAILDDQTFEGEDDDFIPTEEIPLSEPIPFPTDI